MESLLGIKIETIGFILQTLGSLLLLGGYAPQIIKLHRTKIPTGISLLFWTMVGIGCTAINVNMIISNAPFEVILTQSLNMIGAWYTLFLVMYCRKLHGMPIKINKTIGLIASFLAGTMVYQIQVLPMAQVGIMFQTIGTVALLTAYIPQIVYLHKVKDATGISRWLFIVIASGLLMVTVNMIISKVNIEIIITEFVNIALILVQYVLTVYYQNKKK
ncbi:PQ-loop domain-containing transporter [Bacillus mycoides]|uniref:PQ-loop domain-containing transporter n=1 Tax=Bacillus mycoides TaxID=1405 RepID=UPI001E2856AB|nr:PQ-loop domain-containing transporter [Bacillus mycoides]